MATQAEIPSQLGKTAIVTGATGGLGYETALALTRAGAEVILTGRDDNKGQSALDKISREVTDAKISYERLDLANLASIADFAQRMHARQSLDLLINNAGVSGVCGAGKPRRTGFEMQSSERTIFGHFLLTAWLLPLQQDAPADQAVRQPSAAWRIEPGSSISMICRARACTRRGRPTGNPSSLV